MAKYLDTRITRVERLGTSYYGNPYFRVFVEDAPYELRTQIDSGMNYGIENRDVLNNPVRLKLSRAGRIESLEILSAESD